MADSKISDLTEATTLDDTDEFVIASAATTKKVTFETVKSESVEHDDESLVLHVNLLAV